MGSCIWDNIRGSSGHPGSALVYENNLVRGSSDASRGFHESSEAVAAEAAVDPKIWIEPEKSLNVLRSILPEKLVSRTMTLVYMRAKPWLDRETYIVSPAMRLSDSVSLYARLINAQNNSWEALRAEWIQLIQLKQTFQTGDLCQGYAENIVDQARLKALTLQLHQAELGVLRAMKRDKMASKKAKALLARQQRERALAVAKALATQRKAGNEKKAAWRTRRQLGKDMTMDDLMK